MDWLIVVFFMGVYPDGTMDSYIFERPSFQTKEECVIAANDPDKIRIFVQKIISDRLGQNNKFLLEPKQQRFSTGRDIFGSTPPTVNEMKGSDIRSWRESSIIDSLPLTAHYVRHKIPAGSPSIQLVKNVGNFVILS